MNQYNEQGKKHGYWEEYWYNGNLIRKGHYLNGQKYGYWERYHDNGKPKEKYYYARM